MGSVIGIGAGDPREQVLRRFAGQQVTIHQRGASEVGQQRIARRIDGDLNGCARGLRGIHARGGGHGLEDFRLGILSGTRKPLAHAGYRLTRHSRLHCGGNGSGVFPRTAGANAAAGTPRPFRSFKVCPAGLLAHRSIASC
jgi:hypothetical protein